MESVWSVSKLSTESVDSRRELVANCVHTADATQLDSFVASASVVCIGLNMVHDCILRQLIQVQRQQFGLVVLVVTLLGTSAKLLL